VFSLCYDIGIFLAALLQDLVVMKCTRDHWLYWKSII